MKKNFPPYLSQLVFHNQNDEIEKINGSDYDLFIWLIYQTHKEYSLNGKIELEVRYKDIKESIKPSPNSDSIKYCIINSIGGWL